MYWNAVYIRFESYAFMILYDRIICLMALIW
jgi:hypothetical protein